MARDTFIKLRVTSEEREAYQAAASRRDLDLSSLVRRSLDRLVKRDARAPDTSGEAAQ